VAWSNADDSSLVERDSVQDGESLSASIEHFSRGAAVLSTRCGLATQRCCRASACRRALLCRASGFCSASEDAGTDGAASDGGPDAPLPDGGTTLTPSCARMIRGTGRQGVVGLAADGAGGFFASGSVAGTVDLGAGPFDTESAVGNGFIGRFDGNCQRMWTRVVPGAEISQLRLLDVHPGGDVVVLGQDLGSADLGGGPLPPGYGDVLARYDGTGGLKWAKKFSSTPAASSLGVPAFGDAGSVYLGGHLTGTIDLGGGVLSGPAPGGGAAMLLARFDTGGNHVWSRTFAPGAQAPNPNNGGIPFTPNHGVVAVLPTGGDIAFVGSFNGYVDVGGGTLPAGEAAPPSWISTLVTKRDAAGNHVWSRSFRGAPNYAARTPLSGVVYVAELGIATVDFGVAGKAGPGPVVVSLSPGGDPVWVRQLPGAEDISRVAVDASGAVTVAGHFRGTRTFAGNTFTSHYVDAGDPGQSNDIFLVRYDAAGNPLWSGSFGGPGVDAANLVAPQAGPGTLLAGGFHGSIDLLGMSYTAQIQDAYVLKLNP
jgi:hypothetical protein